MQRGEANHPLTCRLVQVLREHCGLDVNETVLRASDLRQSGGEAAAQGDLEAAEYLFTQAGHRLTPSPPAPLGVGTNRREGCCCMGHALLTGAQHSTRCCPHYCYSQGIEMQPSLGQHLLLMARSEVRLMQGNAEGGLADARAAAACAPQTFLFPFVLQVCRRGGVQGVYACAG